MSTSMLFEEKLSAYAMDSPEYTLSSLLLGDHDLTYLRLLYYRYYLLFYVGGMVDACNYYFLKFLF